MNYAEFGLAKEEMLAVVNNNIKSAKAQSFNIAINISVAKKTGDTENAKKLQETIEKIEKGIAEFELKKKEIEALE